MAACGCALQQLDIQVLVSILSEPKNALVKQYKKIFSAENVILDFEDDALTAIAEQALSGKRVLEDSVQLWKIYC